MEGSGLLSKCFSSEGMSVCMMGMIFGIILTIILVWYYMTYVAKKGEGFVDPNDLDPQTKALLAMHNASDPTSNAMMKRMYGPNA